MRCTAVLLALLAALMSCAPREAEADAASSCPAIGVTAAPTALTLSWPPVPGRPFYRVEFYRGKFPDSARLEDGSSGAAPSAAVTYRVEGLVPQQHVRIAVCAGATREACPGGNATTSCTTQLDATTGGGNPRCETRFDTDAAAGTALAGAVQSPDALLGSQLSAQECCARCLALRAALPYRPRCGAATWERATGACYAKRSLADDKGELLGRQGWDTLLTRFD